MSYSLSFYSFSDGELSEPDMDVVRSLLSPHAAAPERTTGADTEFWIRAADGSEAEVNVFENIIGVERPQVGDVWKIIIELADRLGAGILIPNGTFLCREDMRAHLPEGMEDDSVFVPEITLEAFERAAGPFKHSLT
ncbi:hypothetical protein ABZ532_03945 [Streptomyces sp. NPDC019396]|uniref:hypothetical protein n=1 Tax=Streptomyces sp. NPDC019396 TaxID=3154687 RepID=UPI0033F33D7E